MGMPILYVNNPISAIKSFFKHNALLMIVFECDNSHHYLRITLQLRYIVRATCDVDMSDITIIYLVIRLNQFLRKSSLFSFKIPKLLVFM